MAVVVVVSNEAANNGIAACSAPGVLLLKGDTVIAPAR
jgi:hypothetical protein